MQRTVGINVEQQASWKSTHANTGAGSYVDTPRKRKRLVRCGRAAKTGGERFSRCN